MVAKWSGEQYAPAAGHHRSFDDWFLERHPPRPDDDVVDAGCGSGEFTATLADLVPEGSVVGVEPDPSMLDAARRHHAPNLEFRRGRLQALDETVGPASADLVVSRAVFHWIPLEEYPTCYRAVHRVLRPGGWFHAESGGAGNARRIVEVLDEIAAGAGLPGAKTEFPDAGIVLELLEQAGLEVPPSGVTTVAQRRSFTRDELRDMLRTQASMAYVPDVPDEVRARFLAEADTRIDDLRRHDGTYDQTFVRLVVLARRPGA